MGKVIKSITFTERESEEENSRFCNITRQCRDRTDYLLVNSKKTMQWRYSKVSLLLGLTIIAVLFGTSTASGIDGSDNEASNKKEFEDFDLVRTNSELVVQFLSNQGWI